jgi:hypothetical protein
MSIISAISELRKSRQNPVRPRKPSAAANIRVILDWMINKCGDESSHETLAQLAAPIVLAQVQIARLSGTYNELGSFSKRLETTSLC